MSDLILKGAKESRQTVGKDSQNSNGTIDPHINFDLLLKFYYFNVYHQRSIRLKAALLSQYTNSDLEKFIPDNEIANYFLYALTMDMEIYGNAFLEQAGTKSDFYLYHVLGFQGRVNKNKEIYQIPENNEDPVKLDGFHFKYHSPSSKYYGEPDYLTTLEQINTTKQADQYNSSFFKNGARPGFGIVFENSSPNQEQVNSFKQFFGSNFKGYSNAHKSLVLHTGKTSDGANPAKVRLEKLSGVEDMSFEKLKNVTRDEIIAAHGVPPRLVGVMSVGGLGGGRELIDQLHAFNEVTIKPKTKVIKDSFAHIGITHEPELIDVTNFKDDSNLISNLVDRDILTTLEAKEILGFNK